VPPNSAAAADCRHVGLRLQFKYSVSGKFVGGAHFGTKLLVVAASVDDAEDEAIRCLESFESVTDWSLTPDRSIPADENNTRMYCQQSREPVEK
jgi:hypothetical protein